MCKHHRVGYIFHHNSHGAIISVVIHSIGTVVPPIRYSQSVVMDFMLETVAADERMRRYVRRIYTHSGIDYRHSVIGDLAGATDQPFFNHAANGRWQEPGTGKRNEIYARESRPLFSGVARQALTKSGFSPGDVTHVVTASCTGFYNPGPDYFIVKDLGLPPGTDRFHVGFMGCCAMFPALKIADAICRSNPDAVVLLTCVELCSLHIQFKADLDTLLSGAIFADGGGAMVVSSRAPRTEQPVLEIGLLSSRLLPDSEDAMAWTIGDNGFDIVLSAYVPKIIHDNIHAAISSQLAGAGLAIGAIHRWAVHPGGREILDKTEKAMGLEPEALAIPREVLRNYGNLSSATLFFVLEAMLREPPRAPDERICAVAFGPGLTAETGLFTRKGAI